MDLSLEKRFSVFVTAGVLLVTALFLTAYSARNPRIARLGSAVVYQMLHPFQVGGRSATFAFSNFWETYLSFVDAKRDNMKLRSRVEALESINAKLLEQVHENSRLRKVLDVREKTGLQGIVANVVGFDASQWVQAISVDKGRNDGVHEGCAVIQGAGVVGQVIAVGSHHARVLLITDSGSGLDALVQDSRARGVVRGLGVSEFRAQQYNLELRYVLREEPLKVGSAVITSGLDGVYPKGLVIGNVVRVSSDTMLQTAVVRPKVEFDSLEMVLIVTAGEKL